MSDLKNDAKQEAALAYAITALRRLDEMFGQRPNVAEHVTTLEKMLADHRIDTLVEAWHEGDDDRPLHEFLGMSVEEYAAWVPAGYRVVDGQIMYSADWL